MTIHTDRLWIKFVLMFVLLCCATTVFADYVVSKVTTVGSGWGDDTACVYLATGQVAKLDLTTNRGRAELSLSITAKTTNADVRIYFDDTQQNVGGCSTGTTIVPHSIFQLK